MKSRAVLLPTTGDPYIVSTWLESYRKFWQDAGAKLYVNLNSGIDEVVMDYSVSLCKQIPNTETVVHDGLIDHGNAITELLNKCSEETVFIAEEDYYILSSGHLERWFNTVEQNPNSAIVSYRGSCTSELMAATVKKYNITNPLYQTQSNFWPSLVCVNRSHLEKTDKNFRAKAFQPGEYIKELDWTPSSQQCGDTFVWMSLQLRALGLDFIYENQWRLCDVIAKGNRWVPPWVHIGSTSMTVNGALLDENMRTLNSRKKQGWPSKYPAVPPPGGESHFEQCAAFWYLTLAHHRIPADHPAQYFNEVYYNAINGFVKACNLNQTRISQWYELFKHYLSKVL